MRLHVQLLDGLEKLTSGVTLTEAMRPAAKSARVFANVNRIAHPTLAEAMHSNQLTPRELHEQMVRSFLYGVVRAEEEQAL